MRHGESESNIAAKDMLDPLLTAQGIVQATNWQEHIRRFGVDLVLVSPLRRAVQTACFVFGREEVPLLLCRHAREMGWLAQENTISSTPETLRDLLDGLPRGGEMQGIDDALHESIVKSEQLSVHLLRELMASRPERTLFVVCHFRVIKALIGKKATNGDIYDCRWDSAGLIADRHFRSPRSNDDCMCN